MENKVYLKSIGISKQFDHKAVIDNFDLCANLGQIHTVLGTKGAGKTTLVRLFSGAVAPDDGYIEVAGRRIGHYTPTVARAYGIQPLYQSQYLMQDLTVAENIFMGEYVPNRAGLLSYRKLRSKADEIFKRMGVEIDSEELPVNLSDFDCQLVQLARVYANEAKIVLADNIVADFNEHQKQQWFEQLARITKQGVGAIYFTHVVGDAFKISDVITVLCGGKRVYTVSRNYFDLQELISRMVGCDEEMVKCLALTQTNDRHDSFEKLTQAVKSNVNLLEYLEGAIDFINRNLEETINPQMVADAVHISTGYLMKLFKTHLDTSIMGYTYKQRIEKSKLMLETSDERISEIAMEVGISNSQYFSVLFKKYTTMTPKEYRKLHSL